MRYHFHHRLFRAQAAALVFLIACSSITTLHAQTPEPINAPSAREMSEAEKKERAETLRLATSSKAEDRISALDRLGYLYMDYDLLWQLMNDADRGVRMMAIQFLHVRSCTTGEYKPLSAELAQKMAAMFEKEVTPERIRSAFAPGHVKTYEAGLSLVCAESLDYLYRDDPLRKCAAEYAAWQQRVLRPLFFAVAAETPAENRHFSHLTLLQRFTDAAMIAEALPVIMRSIDDPALSSPALLSTLQMLWSNHDLLGQGRPLHILLLAHISPRLESLRHRILDPMQDKEQAALLIGYYTEAIQTAREKLGPPPQPPSASVK